MDVVRCWLCEEPLQARAVPGATPHSWDDLVYRCDACGWGYSNAKSPSARVRIARDPSSNVPEEVRAGLIATLARAVNVRNQKAKVWKFASASSEDAVTSTVVRGLQQLDRLDMLVPTELRSAAPTTPAVLLWGVPAGGGGDDELALRLRGISDAIEERPSSRTEPDVVLSWPDLLVIVEAKFKSPNDRKAAAYKGWPTYYNESCFDARPDEVFATGLYELVRNWRIGLELAGERRFVLVNLAMTLLDLDVEQLSRVVRTSSGRVAATHTWARALADVEGWLRNYAVLRGLLAAASVG